MRVLRGPGRRIAAVLLVSAGGSLATHAAAPQIPLETFAAGPEVESPRVSPDGSHLIFIVTGPKGERLLAARDLKSGKVKPIPGDEVIARLREKSAARRCQPGS